MSGVKLRPMSEIAGNAHGQVLVLETNGVWSVVSVDKSWRHMFAGLPRLTGEISGESGYEASGGPYAACLDVNPHDCVGWIDLDTLPKEVTP